jgi:hypothetical protein
MNLHDTRFRATTAKEHGERLPSADNRLIRAHARPTESANSRMPSLIRFLLAVAVLAGLSLAGLWSLANLVEPQPREMSVTIPQEKIGR